MHRRTRPDGGQRRAGRRALLSALAAASLGATLGITGVANAEPDYPTWQEVEAARANAAAAARTVAELETLVTALAGESAQLGQVALLRGEQYNQAMAELDAARSRADRLRERADAAAAAATASTRRAGQLLAQFARTGGGDVTLALLTDRGSSGDLLRDLGRIGQLSARSSSLVDQAVADRNAARTLLAQADAAASERDALADAAAALYGQAQSAADTSSAGTARQSSVLDQLYAQLASLKGTSAAVERAYYEGLEWERRQSAGSPPAVPPPLPAPGGSGAQPPAAPAPAPTPTPTPTQAPAPWSPSPSPSATPSPSPSPTPSPSPAPQPSASAVQTAIAFASAQLGEPYLLGGRGPDAWDCSGLTLMSYSAAGVGIGTHSATNQYSTMAARGLLVPYNQMLAGDLLFYSTGGATSGSKYHVTLYLGGGTMIEAPYPGKTVRVAPVRYGDLVPYVGRPTG